MKNHKAVQPKNSLIILLVALIIFFSKQKEKNLLKNIDSSWVYLIVRFWVIGNNCSQIVRQNREINMQFSGFRCCDLLWIRSLTKHFDLMEYNQREIKSLRKLCWTIIEKNRGRKTIKLTRFNKQTKTFNYAKFPLWEIPELCSNLDHISNQRSNKLFLIDVYLNRRSWFSQKLKR